MASIGKQIKAARKAKGMTQSQLAGMLSMSRQGVSHWEANRTMPDAQTLLQLSRILGFNFETNMPHEAENEPVMMCHFTLSATHEGHFPFYPEQLTALLQRDNPEKDADRSAAEETPQYPHTRPNDTNGLQIKFRTRDPGISSVYCIVHGRDKAGNALHYHTAAELVLEEAD